MGHKPFFRKKANNVWRVAADHRGQSNVTVALHTPDGRDTVRIELLMATHRTDHDLLADHLDPVFARYTMSSKSRVIKRAHSANTQARAVPYRSRPANNHDLCSCSVM